MANYHMDETQGTITYWIPSTYPLIYLSPTTVDGSIHKTAAFVVAGGTSEKLIRRPVYHLGGINSPSQPGHLVSMKYVMQELEKGGLLKMYAGVQETAAFYTSANPKFGPMPISSAEYRNAQRNSMESSSSSSGSSSATIVPKKCLILDEDIWDDFNPLNYQDHLTLKKDLDASIFTYRKHFLGVFTHQIHTIPTIHEFDAIHVPLYARKYPFSAPGLLSEEPDDYFTFKKNMESINGLFANKYDACEKSKMGEIYILTRLHEIMSKAQVTPHERSIFIVLQHILLANLSSLFTAPLFCLSRVESSPNLCAYERFFISWFYQSISVPIVAVVA